LSEVDRIKEKIKSRGYWEVDIRPDEGSRDRFDSISDCFNKVKDCVVLIRGWDYPHFSNHPSPYPMNRRIESYVEFGASKEFWTMFINGHFYHIFACQEDWLSDDTPIMGKSQYSNIEPRSVLDFINTLYNFTEIFEFAIRLSQKGIFGNNARIQITLHGMQDRKLTSFDTRRHLWYEYRCREDTIPRDVHLSVDDLISKGHEKAVDSTIAVLQLFKWLDVKKEIIQEAQKAFLERRF
jgi:hypothetical protein